MKKNLMFAMFGAIALTGSVGITSCTDEDEVANVSPYYNPDTNEVVTQFVLNVAADNTSATRQSADIVQSNDITTGRFRGMSDVVLYSYIHPNPSTTGYIVTSNGAEMNKRFDFASLMSSSDISTSASRRVVELSLPLQTNTLLFYGIATPRDLKSEEAGKYTKDDVNGVSVKSVPFGVKTAASGTTPAVNYTLDDARISLQPRLYDDASKNVYNLTSYRQVEKLLAGILTCIANVNLSGSNHIEISKTARPTGSTTVSEGGNDVTYYVKPYGFDVAKADYPADLAWVDYANENGIIPMHIANPVALFPLEEKLANAYKQYTVIRASRGELRSASGQAIQYMMKDLLSVLNSVRCAQPVNKNETVAKYMAEKICTEIKNYFDASLPVDGGSVMGNVDIENAGNAINDLLQDSYWPSGLTSCTSSDFDKITSTHNLSEFPVSFGMSRGASHVDFKSLTKGGYFEYPSAFNTSGIGNQAVSVTNYYYPPELMYFGNSPIRVSNTEHTVGDYPNGTSNWLDNWSTDWVDKGSVSSTTRSVAMRNNIHYGTALLETRVGYKTLILKDNNHTVQAIMQGLNSGTELDASIEPDKEITVSDNSFKLTGIIIGQQPKSVGWNYIPVLGNSTDAAAIFKGAENGVIFDRVIPSEAEAIPANTLSGKTHTLCFDNYDGSQTSQLPVYVALEFLNNSGQDFYGNFNLIHQGGYFYLIGKLDPNNLNTGEGELKDKDIAWPEEEGRVVPPYNTDGTSNKVKRVFIQDFETKATFRFGENTLKSAYLTVPDLRSSSLTLGLSVDIEWEKGIEFNDVVLGQ